MDGSVVRNKLRKFRLLRRKAVNIKDSEINVKFKENRNKSNYKCKVMCFVIKQLQDVKKCIIINKATVMLEGVNMGEKMINEEKNFYKDKQYYKCNRKLEIALFIVGIVCCLIAVIMIYIIKDYYIFLLVAGCGIVIELIALAVLIINYNFSKQNEYMWTKQKEDKMLLNEIFNMSENQKIEIIKKLMLDEENK